MDNSTGFVFNKGIVIIFIALVLMGMGVIVPITWHHPHLFPSVYHTITAMAYNTAICFFLAGAALLALHLHKRLVMQACGYTILLISSVRLAEIIFAANLHTNDWFSILVNADLKTSIPMHPTTAINFILVGISLLLPNLVTKENINQSAIWSMFLSLLVIASSLITLLGHGIGLLPSFVWLGIKMAPHTAIGFVIFAIGLIIQLHLVAIHSFNRFNFFKRLIIGFGFMSMLFIGIGSVALMQINSVSAITQELHQNPLQINYTALHIKNNIGKLNRQLKDIAIKPELIQQIDIAAHLEQTHLDIKQDIALILQKDSTLDSELQVLITNFMEWRNFILTSNQLLKNGDTQAFRERTLNEGQDYTITMEALVEELIAHTQDRILELNLSVLETENDAKNLLLVCITGLLGIGLLVAYLITRSLTGQLQKLRYAMLDIAHDNTDIPIPFLDHGEEIGDMAKTLEIFARNTAIRRRMEIRMSKIIEATPNGIIMINREGHIEIMNQQAEKIFGYHREQLLGKSIEELIPTRMANTHPHSRHEYFNNPTPRAMGVGRELFGLRQDNSEFPLEIGLAPIETEEGTKVLASIVDISERKKAEQILKEHQQELERYNSRLSQTNKELETFAYVASHDLKSPLRGIAQLSSWIEEDLAEKDFSNIENHTSMLRNRIQRMEKLLDDLLIFYRAGKIDGNLVSVDMGHMAKELFEIQNNKPGLQLELGVNLPTLTTLSTPFEQVLRNLFSNAIKHHDHDQGKIQFSCRDIDRHFYEFSVCDDGPGIPQQFQERIFGMFQTLKPRDELEGSGMGLALIKKIVENYGGTIVVSSEGRGCCFRFTWPKNIKRNNNND